MDVAIDQRWAGFVEDVVRDGKFDSVSDVVNEGLRLVEARETKLQALRETLQASLARGGSNTGADVLTHVKAGLDEWERKRASV